MNVDLISTRPQAEWQPPGTGDLLSPELVLVDPHLALGARALLSDPDDTLARLGQRPTNGVSPPRAAIVDPTLSSEDVGAALRRITELSELEPSSRPRHRLVSAISVMAAWSAVAVFVADLQLGLCEWPGWPLSQLVPK
jgi:hypothetical protein